MANDEPDKTEELSDAELDAASGGLKVDMKDLLITMLLSGLFLGIHLQKIRKMSSA